MDEIVNLKQLKDEDQASVGYKAATLGELSRGFNVAPGFVISNDFFQHLTRDIQGSIKTLISRAEGSDEEGLQQISDEIQRMILDLNIDEESSDSITELFYSLNIDENQVLQELVDTNQDPVVLIRTSVIGEAQDALNLLFVNSKERLLKGIVTCYASLYSPSSLDGIKECSIIVQKMIIPHISGDIMMHDGKILVRACYGMIDNDTECDSYLVTAEDLQIETITVEKQNTSYMEEDGQLAKVNLSEIKSSAQKLNDKQIQVLARLFKRTKYTDRVIEYIIDKENYFFVQVKEETNMGENAIFSIFNANKGDKKPEIPTEPEKDPAVQPVEQNVSQESESTVNQESEETAEETDNFESQETKESNDSDTAEVSTSESVQAAPDQSINDTTERTSVSEPGPMTQIVDSEPSPVDDEKDSVESTDEESTDTEPGKQEKSESELSEASTNSESELSEASTNSESELSEASTNSESEAQETTASEPDAEKTSQTETVSQEPEVLETSSDAQMSTEDANEDDDQVLIEEEVLDEERQLASDIRPLNTQEWVETLNMEHTKLLLSYDLIIMNALREQYQHLFSKDPGDFESMVEEVDSKISLSELEGVKKIRALRNKFMYHHETVDMDELKSAYECTIRFLKDLQ